METTIRKTVKGATMEAIFNTPELLNVRYFKCLNLDSEDNFDPEYRYKYEIKIRHAENEDANVLFEEARFKNEIKN